MIPITTVLFADGIHAGGVAYTTLITTLDRICKNFVIFVVYTSLAIKGIRHPVK